MSASQNCSMKIGLMGGSFNPMHEGHISVAKEAIRRLNFDQIWLLVTPGNPLKPSLELAPLQERIKNVQEKIRYRRIKALSIEEELGSHFTANLIYYLKGRCSGVKFVWIMGADNLASFHLWNHWALIVNQVPVLIIDRPGWRFKALSSRVARRIASCRLKEERCKNLFQHTTPVWAFLTNRLLSDSSTKIRRIAQK